MKVFKVLGIVTILISLSSPVYSGDNTQYTIRDKNYRVQGYVRDGKIYDRNYRIEGYVQDNKIYDRDYRQKGYIDRNNKGYGGHNSGRRK